MQPAMAAFLNFAVFVVYGASAFAGNRIILMSSEYIESGDFFMEEKAKGNHTLTLTNRESLSLGGITDVDSFNEEEITAFTACGDLTVKGEMLHVEALNLECGEMQISGKVTALIYSESGPGLSVFKRLFRG